MPITTVETRSTIEQLISRHYGDLPAAKRKELRAAILAANPHLGDSTNLEPGTVVVLPALAGGTAARADNGVSPEMIERIRQALSVYRDELVTKIGNRDTELAVSMRTLQSDRFKRMLDNVPGSSVFLESMTLGSGAERDELKELHKFVSTELDKLIDDLKMS